MKTILIATTALGLALASGAALAQGSAAKQQLADSLKVNADDYTIMELTQMKCIMDGDNTEAEKKRLLEAVKGFGTPVDPPAGEKAQLAASLGVNPAEYTLAELSLLKSMMEDDECDVDNPADYVRTRGEMLTEPAASAKMQLARALGVKPTDYTLVELVKMKAAGEGEDSHN